MSDENGAQPEAEGAGRAGRGGLGAVHPGVWFVLGAATVLLLASLTGNGTGLFGWGFMVGMMWMWMLVPILLVVLLVLLLPRRGQE